jgi:hypothetical protein
MDTTTLTIPELQAGFLLIMPLIERHGRVYFRHLKAEAKEEALCEMVALCWAWYLRLMQRGKDATQFPTVLADYAAKAVRCGRRLCGHEKAKDVLSPVARHRHHFEVERLAGSTQVPHEQLYGEVDGQRHLDAFEERLRDNTQTPVIDQVCFRQDFPSWLATHTDRHRRLIGDLMLGERTMDMARKYGLSPARISQLRGEFHRDWLAFCDDLPAHAHGTPAVV